MYRHPSVLHSQKHWKVNPDDKYCTEYRDGVKFFKFPDEAELAHWVVYGNDLYRSDNPYSASKQRRHDVRISQDLVCCEHCALQQLWSLPVP